MRSIIIAFLALYATNSFAASRNCTADEKTTADKQLIEIANDTEAQLALASEHLPFGIHSPNSVATNQLILYQGGYVLSYDADLLTTLWASYRLTNADISGASGNDRINCFRTDPRLNDKSPKPSDYDEPIYDRGHMANDADLKDDTTEQVNSYIYSNMSPQHCRFNRGIWLSLEHMTRKWASNENYNRLLVTTGAIFDRDETIGRDLDTNALRMASNNGKSRVAVPSHYYKIFLRQDIDGWKSIAFLLPHNNNSAGLTWQEVLPEVMDSITSIEKIEERTGGVFHPALKRGALEQSLDGSGWALVDVPNNFSHSINNNNSCVTNLP